MACIDVHGGCKVGWETFDTEAEAVARAKEAALQRDRKFALGFDFGYQWPGAITHHELHPRFGVECWTVIVP